MKSLQPQRLKEILQYNPITGVVSNRKKNRVLIADPDGLVSVFCSVAKKNYKLKLDKLAYILYYDMTPMKNQRILHKDLDQNNNKANNLVLLPRSLYFQIKEAHRNLTEFLNIKPHPIDQFCYLVHWLEKGKEKTKMTHDLIEARKIQLKLQLKYSKILTKYCLFE